MIHQDPPPLLQEHQDIQLDKIADVHCTHIQYISVTWIFNKKILMAFESVVRFVGTRHCVLITTVRQGTLVLKACRILHDKVQHQRGKTKKDLARNIHQLPAATKKSFSLLSFTPKDVDKPIFSSTTASISLYCKKNTTKATKMNDHPCMNVEQR